MTSGNDFDEIVASLIKQSATKQNQKNIYHTWYGWVSKDVLHVVSTSGARRREIWHFGVEKNKGRQLLFKNTTGTADCWTVVHPEDEPDPYERILRICGSSKKSLFRHKPGEVVEFSGRWENLHCHYPNGVSCTVVHNSSEVIVEGEYTHGRNWHRHKDWSVVLEHATWALVLSEYADRDGRVSASIGEMHVWGNPDPAAIATAAGVWMRKTYPNDYKDL